MEAVVRDRDVLGSQLVRRNDELALLYEKIRLQQSTISQGNAAYRCAPVPYTKNGHVALVLLQASNGWKSVQESIEPPCRASIGHFLGRASAAELHAMHASRTTRSYNARRMQEATRRSHANLFLRHCSACVAGRSQRVMSIHPNIWNVPKSR